jgi:chorismate lyase/3-hydroxybenzoate synthase
LFAAIDIDEREQGGICAAAEVAYAEMQRFQQQSAFPQLLRMWNYMDAINEGTGDLERYRQFCVGRTRGLGDMRIEHYPAATAIGFQRSTHHLLVYWLASRTPGKNIENPRQVSAYRYPRAHGPTSPTFARATLSIDGTLLVSGTASIVGHVSQHDGNPLAQLEETLRNLSILDVGARDESGAAIPTQANALLKVYVREAAHMEAIALRLRDLFPRSNVVFLAADICRSELLLEIECLRLAA